MRNKTRDLGQHLQRAHLFGLAAWKLAEVDLRAARSIFIGLAAYGVHACLAVMVIMVIVVLAEDSLSFGKTVCTSWLSSRVDNSLSHASCSFCSCALA